ncbi:hypothetical protein QYF36_016111 [Acer negundo]|nr:hypothetical protein QYF36_016111 [Acer negundo]
MGPLGQPQGIPVEVRGGGGGHDNKDREGKCGTTRAATRDPSGGAGGHKQNQKSSRTNEIDPAAAIHPQHKPNPSCEDNEAIATAVEDDKCDDDLSDDDDDNDGDAQSDDDSSNGGSQSDGDSDFCFSFSFFDLNIN